MKRRKIICSYGVVDCHSVSHNRALSAVHLTMLFPLQHGGPCFHKVLELLIFRITVVPKILSFV